jgi:hypothetical protein
MPTKICTKCGVEKDVGEFCKDKHKKSGVVSHCKECKRKEYWADSSKKHRVNYDCEPGLKICHKCGSKKSISEFGKNKSNKDGFSHTCKECLKEEYLNKPNIKHRKKHNPKPGFKVCTTCEEEKPLYYFSRDARSLKERDGDGYKPQCKECDRTIYINDQDRVSKYLLENHERILNRDREYKINNSDKISRYYWENKEEILKKHSEYGKSPSGKIAKSRAKHKRRSSEGNTEATLTLKQWNKILKMQNNKCADCEREFDEKLKPTKDHIIPVSIGGDFTFGNVQALCQSCNSKKHNRIDFLRAIDNLLVK